MAAFEFEVIWVSSRVNEKINARHDLTVLDVEEACERRLGTPRWDTDEEGRVRLFVTGETDGGRKIRVILFPTEIWGEWNLATAYPVP